jgi:hypothetical protein
MKKTLSVHKLRKAGFNVSLAHIRRFHRFDPQTGKKRTVFLNPHEKPFLAEYADFYLTSSGGLTIIKLERDGITATGIAKCSSKDSYVRKVGVVKALGKAVQTYNTAAKACDAPEYVPHCDEQCSGVCSQ